MPTPSQLTLDRYRAAGYIIDATERWIPRTRRRKDLFGFGDFLAIPGVEDISPHRQAVIIQCTTSSNMAARVKKILGPCAEAAEAWLKTGNRIIVFGWKGETARTREITLADFN